MKKFTSSWMRSVLLGLTAAFAIGGASAASITVDGINYTTASGGKATVARYQVKPDSLFYKGDIVIPETIEYNGATYTVVATAANAFASCRELTSLQLPATCVTIGRNCFKDCVALKNDPTPLTATSIGNGYLQGCASITEVTVPAPLKTVGTGAAKFTAQNWEGMTSLKKITFADAADPFTISALAFVSTLGTAVKSPIEEIYFGRPLDQGTSSNMPFRGIKTLKKVTFGGEFTTVNDGMFEGCTGLTDVIYAAGNKVTTLGASAFRNCSALPSLTIPANMTEIPTSLCYGCKNLTSVTMGDAVTTVGITAFYNTGLKSLPLPASVQTIYSQAFQNSALTGDVVLPASLTSVGSQAFAGTKIASVSIPAGVSSIGSAAFAPITTLANVTVADGNTAFKVVDGALVNAEGTRLLVTGHQGTVGTTAFADVTTIDNYGMAYAPCTVAEFPALQNVGNYGFAYSAIKSFELKNNVTVGANIFSNSALETLVFEDGRNEIPQGIAANCANLSNLTLPTTATNIMKDAFANCTALKSMELPANVNYMEPGSVPATIESLRVLNGNTPALAADVFNASQSNVVCKVATSSVAKYKAAAQWQYLNIQADPTIKTGGSSLGCPTGLYFATTDGKLMYKDEAGEIVDTKFTTGAHALTLQSYKNRIYVAVAGEKFTYQDPNQPLGDGELFYVNNTNGIFYRVTVLNNVGYIPSEDPFSMTIDKSTNNIYIADRNVGVHKLNADTTGLYGSQPFLFQNQWLPYYGDLLSWGAITGGFTRDSKGIYWRTTKFNGLGLTRFRDNDIYPEGGAGKTQHFNVLFKDVIIKTSYLDEENGFYYMFVQKDPYGAKPGIYRIALSRLQNADGSDVAGNNELTIADCQLIDDSPVLLEGAPDSGEIANVAQINGDGTNIFWSYIAPETDADAIAGSTPLDETNPLHKSGIKSIKSADAQPVVTFAVEGVKAYGVCGATYVAPPVVNPTSITLDKTEATVENGGETLQLVATVLPEEADNKNVVWTSSDATIATVDENGLVTTIKQATWDETTPCTVTITAACEANLDLKASCVVTIVNPTAEVKPESITLNYDEYIMPTGVMELQLVATVLPENTTNPSVRWTSNDETVATVDANGLVTIVPENKSRVAAKATADREVTIMAACVANPQIVATCVITVPGEVTGVTDIYGTKAISSIKYYNVAGMESETPYKGVNLVVTNYTDGSQAVSKLVK